jgi:hypothetical protein
MLTRSEVTLLEHEMVVKSVNPPQGVRFRGNTNFSCPELSVPWLDAQFSVDEA